MSGNQRGYTWLDDNAEHSEADEIRAKALAAKWSQIHNAAEERMFRKMSDREEGRDDGWEPDECPTCEGFCVIGVDLPKGRWPGCNDACPRQLVGINCPNPDCEDGYDVAPMRQAERAEAEREATHRLEMEIVEEMLARIGARMCRPYEHWNESEREIEYLETRYDYE